MTSWPSPTFRPTPHRRAVLAGIASTLIPLGAAAGDDSPGHGTSADDRSGRTLTAAPMDHRFEPAEKPAEMWSLDGSMAGPIIRVRHGDDLRLALANRTPRPLSLHWQGVCGPNAMDGVGGLTQSAIAPQASFAFRLTPPDPGTFLGRPLVLGGASEPAGRGLSALLIVDEKDPPAVDADYALMVRDWLLAPSGELAAFGDPKQAASTGRLGNRMTADGDAVPKRIALGAGQRLRLRLANACNARLMRIRFDGMQVAVVAVDGQPADAFSPLNATLPFAPGTRYDILVDLPKNPGGKASLTALIGDGLPLLEIAVGASDKPVPERGPIKALAANPRLPAEIRLQDALRADLVLAGGAMRARDGQLTFPPDPHAIWTMNGAPGSVDAKPFLSVPRGRPVVLGITNRTEFPQPMHLHGHVCRLLHALDDGWEPYWLDTFLVPEGRTVHVAFLADNPGRWLLGSSVLERLDTGLWGWFEVT